jgi:hypothetical protein
MTNDLAFKRTKVAMLVVVAGGLMAVTCARDQATPEGSNARAQVLRLQRTNTLLQRQIELASGKDFYLVLDPEASELTLMLSGTELQRCRVLGLRVGQPRVSWLRRRDARPWQDATWSHGELDPPRQIDRLVMQAAPPGKDAAAEPDPPVPPTPEEMYPVPSRYQVRFDEGRSIEIRPLDADAQAGRLARLRAWWSAKWHDVVAAVFGSDRDVVRLRIVLAPKDAASLYRSLPPAVRLIIVAEDSAAAPGGASRPSPARVPAAGKNGG